MKLRKLQNKICIISWKWNVKKLKHAVDSLTGTKGYIYIRNELAFNL